MYRLSKSQLSKSQLKLFFVAGDPNETSFEISTVETLVPLDYVLSVAYAVLADRFNGLQRISTPHARAFLEASGLPQPRCDFELCVPMETLLRGDENDYCSLEAMQASILRGVTVHMDGNRGVEASIALLWGLAAPLAPLPPPGTRSHFRV